MQTAVLLAVLVVAVAANTDEEWEGFKTRYNKAYLDSSEEQQRRQIWEDHLNIINLHNAAADRGEHTYWLGVNEYADMSNEEFKVLLTGYIQRTYDVPGYMKYTPRDSQIPAEFDFRDRNYVSSVKNQGKYASGWAFSATGALESMHRISNGNFTYLSEQNLIDCSGVQGDSGCLGGQMEMAFRFVMSEGIATEDSYPYSAASERRGVQECYSTSARSGVTIDGYKVIESGSEEHLALAMTSYGPICAAMDAAGHTSFQLYRAGVYSNPMCSSTTLNHGVLVIGLGPGYWLVKNSWGTSWGDGGYFKIARSQNNMCGLATQASFPYRY